MFDVGPIWGRGAFGGPLSYKFTIDHGRRFWAKIAFLLSISYVDYSKHSMIMTQKSSKMKIFIVPK